MNILIILVSIVHISSRRVHDFMVYTVISVYFNRAAFHNFCGSNRISQLYSRAHHNKTPLYRKLLQNEQIFFDIPNASKYLASIV